MSFAITKLVLPAILLAGAAVRADTEAEWTNPSSRAFTIRLVAFDRTAGKLTFRDGSAVAATWDRTTADGAAIPWPALRTFRVTYSGTTSANANFRIRVEDGNGNWVSFRVNNPTVGSPTLAMDGAAPGLDEHEGAGFLANGLKGGFKLSNKGTWNLKHDGTSF